MKHIQIVSVVKADHTNANILDVLLAVLGADGGGDPTGILDFLAAVLSKSTT